MEIQVNQKIRTVGYENSLIFRSKQTRENLAVFDARLYILKCLALWKSDKIESYIAIDLI